MSKIAIVSAKWSKDIEAFVATIDGNKVIIEIGATENGVASTKKEPVVKKSATVARTESKPKKRTRAKSLSADDKAKATGLIADGKSFDETKKEIAGLTKGIFQSLKRKAPKSKAKTRFYIKAKPTSVKALKTGIKTKR